MSGYGKKEIALKVRDFDGDVLEVKEVDNWNDEKDIEFEVTLYSGADYPIVSLPKSQAIKFAEALLKRLKGEDDEPEYLIDNFEEN